MDKKQIFIASNYRYQQNPLLKLSTSHMKERYASKTNLLLEET